MHLFTLTLSRLTPLAIQDWFALTVPDLESIAVALLGERIGRPWVRDGARSVAIANLKLGSVAGKLPLELDALRVEAQRLLAAGGVDSALRAAAFYHLRFENIHPLGEGNGRVGRVILAAQIEQSLGIPVEETLRQLNAHENDYKMVFASGVPEIMFELMLDLVARLTGHTASSESSRLPGSILPLYPDRGPLVKGTRGPDRGATQNPKRPQSGGHAFRKFR